MFIDAGCYDGQTILDFIDFCNGEYKKIYGFEPDRCNYKRTADNLKGLNNITLLNKGLWSVDSELAFDEANSTTSCLTESGRTVIPVTSIDSTLAGEHATFIKMDIEGAELGALHGARNTIIKGKPKLAICVYHKPEDVLSIPFYILELVPEYKFFIRHHYHTVIFATV